MNRAAAILALLFATQSLAMGGDSGISIGNPSVTPISRGGTGQTSNNFTADFPPGLATLFVFNVFQMRQDSSLVDTPQFIPAVSSSAQAPTLLVGALGGTTNPTLVARKWTAATLSVAGVGSSPTANPCPQFSNIQDPGALAISATGKFEFMMLLQQQNTGANTDVIMNTSLGADTAGFRLTTAGATGGGGNYIWAVSNAAVTINTLSATATTTRAIRRKWHVVDVSGDGTNQTMRIFTLGSTIVETVGPTANSNSPASTPGQPVTIGSNYACANSQNVHTGGIAIWARALTTTERSAGVTALFRSAELDPSVDMKKLVIVGDSILAGAVPSVDPTPYQYLQALLPGWRITQRAVTGTATAAISTSLTDELTVETPDVVIVEGGVNDITAAVADATISTNLLGMCTAAKAVGAKCILMNITPGSTGNQIVHTPIVNATSAAYTIPTQIDAFFNANVLLADPPGTVQTSWNVTYQSDTLHPNTFGNKALARGLADAVIALAGN